MPLRLVNWADEEGARFGRSLFGSSAAAGSMRDQDELAKLTDRDGVSLPDAVGRYGVSLENALDARSQLENLVFPSVVGHDRADLFNERRTGRLHGHARQDAR